MKTRDVMSELDFNTMSYTSRNTSSDPASNLLQNVSSLICESKRPRPYDIETQSYNPNMAEDTDPYSPYYSPLEAQKQMDTILQAWRSAEKYTENWIGFWKSKGDCFLMVIIA
jgi:hypothetical protein